jgi:hypothetical protein
LTEGKVIALCPADWFRLRDGFPVYRVCDLCLHDCLDQVLGGKTAAEFTKFFAEYTSGVGETGSVCEGCLDEYLSRPPR